MLLSFHLYFTYLYFANRAQKFKDSMLRMKIDLIASEKEEKKIRKEWKMLKSTFRTHGSDQEEVHKNRCERIKKIKKLSKRMENMKR